MSIGQIILGVLMFAAVTALLYVWGLRRSLDQRADLERGLMNACGSKVVRYLKKNGFDHPGPDSCGDRRREGRSPLVPEPPASGGWPQSRQTGH